MNKDRWVLPEGIEELLPQDAQHIEMLRRDLLDLFFYLPPMNGDKSQVPQIE